METSKATDFVTMNIIESSMISACREMGITLMKTSYSTIFNEALDFTCAIASAEGEMWAVAEFCPAQIGGMPLIISSSLKEIPLDTINPGDVIVHNDPYRGGLHTPEHTLFCPVFVDDQLVAFTVAIGHVAEVGGMVPGGFASEATEIFHEGIRVPPVKIKKRGEDVEEVWKLWLANVRTPRYNYGDMRALISGVEVGAERLAQTISKYGVDHFRKICADLMDYSEARMRAEIRDLPDGAYPFHDFMDNDGVTDQEIRINVECFIQDDEIVVDFEGSSPQVGGPINATLGVTWSAAYNAILHLTDPSIPKNSGCFRPIHVLAPAGTVVNVDFRLPAALCFTVPPTGVDGAYSPWFPVWGGLNLRFRWLSYAPDARGIHGMPPDQRYLLMTDLTRESCDGVEMYGTLAIHGTGRYWTMASRAVPVTFSGTERNGHYTSASVSFTDGAADLQLRSQMTKSDGTVRFMGRYWFRDPWRQSYLRRDD